MTFTTPSTVFKSDILIVVVSFESCRESRDVNSGFLFWVLFCLFYFADNAGVHQRLLPNRQRTCLRITNSCPLSESYELLRVWSSEIRATCRQFIGLYYNPGISQRLAPDKGQNRWLPMPGQIQFKPTPNKCEFRNVDLWFSTGRLADRSLTIRESRVLFPDGPSR